MAVTITSSDYNGDFLGFLYLVLSIGNEIAEKGAARMLEGIAKKRALPKLSQTANPMRAYTTGVPASETVTTTYSERSLAPNKMTLYETFIPEDTFDIWEKWHPQGDLTNLRQNPEFMADVIAMYANGAGNQFSALFWQGDKSLGASNPLGYIDGIITRLKTDVNAIAVTPAGAITKGNIVERLEEVWQAIPDKFLEDPRYIINLSTQDWKLLQIYNNDAKKTTVGVLTQGVESLFLNNRIVHYSNLPKDHIVAALSDPNSDESNLFTGAYVGLDGENPNIDKVDNHSKEWATRIDWALDVNYREPSEIVFYEPV